MMTFRAIHKKIQINAILHDGTCWCNKKTHIVYNLTLTSDIHQGHPNILWFYPYLVFYG